MRFTLQIITIIILAFILESFLPWWSIAIAAFLAGVFVRSTANFLAGFLAIALLWFVKAWMIDAHAAAPLAEKVANIFPLHNKMLLLVVMSVLGGLVGGFSAMSGSFAKKKS